jgi:preprotein translocase subunit SecF
MPIRIIPDNTHIPFMRAARLGFVLSVFLMIGSIALAFTAGLNFGIDFKGGTLIEVQSKAPEADLSAIRTTLDGLGLGDIEVQGFGSPDEVLIRIATQPGGDAAQQVAVQKAQGALGSEDYTYRRVEVVGPRISGELAWDGTLSVIATMIGVLLYIWFRFEWQFGIGAIATLVHDVVLTIGFFAVTQLDFNLSSIAAILTILGYSLNDTVVVFDRIREILRRYKQMPVDEVIDTATNQVLARTIMTSLTTLIALFALFIFGGSVIRSFTAAMIFGVFVGTYSSIFIGGPILIYFRIRQKAGEPVAETAEAEV